MNNPIASISCEELLSIKEDTIVKLQEQCAKMREALEEIAKPPYKDSDLGSLFEWANKRARSCLKELDADTTPTKHRNGTTVCKHGTPTDKKCILCG